VKSDEPLEGEVLPAKRVQLFELLRICANADGQQLLLESRGAVRLLRFMERNAAFKES